MARFQRYGARLTQPTWGSGGDQGGIASSSFPGSSGGSAGSSPTAGRTGWVNVQNYLQANQGAADQMGANLASELDTQAQGAASEANQYRTDLAAYKKGAVPAAIQNQAEIDAWQKARDAAASQPGAVDLRRWNYDHPKPAEVWSPASRAALPTVPTSAGDTLAKINTAATPAGRAELMAGKSGPSYSAGQSNLDSYLAGAGAGGKALNALPGKYSQVLDLINNPDPLSSDPAAGRDPAAPPGSGRTPVTVDPTMGPVASSLSQPATGRLPNNKKNVLRWS